MKSLKRVNIGSVVSGSTHPRDLIPALASELYMQPTKRREHHKLLREIERAEAIDPTWDATHADEYVDALVSALNYYAPPWFYFGACSVDHTDFGFWLVSNFDQDYDGLRVDELANIPSKYVGHVLVTNDHGNLSLYRRGANHRLYEEWSIV